MDNIHLPSNSGSNMFKILVGTFEKFFGNINNVEGWLEDTEMVKLDENNNEVEVKVAENVSGKNQKSTRGQIKGQNSNHIVKSGSNFTSDSDETKKLRNKRKNQKKKAKKIQQQVVPAQQQQQNVQLPIHVQPRAEIHPKIQPKPITKTRETKLAKLAASFIENSQKCQPKITANQSKIFSNADFIKIFTQKCSQVLMALVKNGGRVPKKADKELAWFMRDLSNIFPMMPEASVQPQPEVIAKLPLVNFIKFLAQLHDRKLLTSAFIARLITDVKNLNSDTTEFALKIFTMLFGRQERRVKVTQKIDEILLHLHVVDGEIENFIDEIWKVLGLNKAGVRDVAVMVKKIGKFHDGFTKKLIQHITTRFETFKIIDMEFLNQNELGKITMFAFELMKVQIIDDHQLVEWLSLKLVEKIPKKFIFEILGAFGDDVESFRVQILINHMKYVLMMMK
jgi:hypothetical protein